MNEKALKEHILQKRELRSIDKKTFEKIYSEEKEKNKELFGKLEKKKFNEKSKEFKEFTKIIRKKLRIVYGVFFKKSLSPEQKQKFIESAKKEKKEDTKTSEKILGLHLSTSERQKRMEEVYFKIFQRTGIPKKILDLGCGFNPFSYKKMGCEPEYIASDISNENLEFIKKYFEIKKINGKTILADLTDIKDLKTLQKEKVDVTFLFKLLDSLEEIKRGSSKNLIENLSSDFLVVSFSKKTIGGKPIKSERPWFLKLIKNIKSQKFTVGQEEYFVLDKRIGDPEPK